MFGKVKELIGQGKNRLAGNTDLLEGVSAACVLVAAADGNVSDDEAIVALERIQHNDTLTAAFTASQIETAFQKQVNRARQGLTGRIALRREIEEVRSKSTAADCEMVLVIAIDVATADDDLGAKEIDALKTVGKCLGLDVNQYLNA